MNIVFFGSARFALPSLRAITSSRHNVCCVLTQPDREKGRGLHLESTAVKAAAQELGLEAYQPQRINTPETIKFLKEKSADLFVVVSYGQILSEEILKIPRIFAINIHASALPRYRGAAPINWAIINGDTTTGITIIKMTKAMDAGPIILHTSAEIKNDDTALTLSDKLSGIAADLLPEALERIQNNDYKLTPQDEDKVTFAPKLMKRNGLIDWDKPAEAIYNLIRGCAVWPGAFTYYNNKLLKIYRASVGGPQSQEASAQASPKGTKPPGEIIEVSKEGIFVASGKDVLIIKELQLEGKRIMKAEEFISGHKIRIKEAFDKKIVE